MTKNDAQNNYCEFVLNTVWWNEQNISSNFQHDNKHVFKNNWRNNGEQLLFYCLMISLNLHLSNKDSWYSLFKCHIKSRQFLFWFSLFYELCVMILVYFSNVLWSKYILKVFLPKSKFQYILLTRKQKLLFCMYFRCKV